MMPTFNINRLQHLPKITIRQYQNSDYDSAYRIIRAIGEAHLGKNLRAWDKTVVEWGARIQVATVDDQVVALAAVSYPFEHLMCLHTDLVDPAYQRRGIGTLLTLFRIASINVESVEQIGVLATEHSHPFYLRFGFVEESPPKYDPIQNHTMYCLGMPYTAELDKFANAVLDHLPNVTYDFGDMMEDSFNDATS